MNTIIKRSLILCCLMVSLIAMGWSQADVTWLEYEPEGKMSNGKHVVLLSGDEEYRSEESMPMLAKILTETYGFKTTVLFAINPENGEIDPNFQTNIPGLEALQSADLMIMLLRFRELPDDQMKYIDEYFKRGKPVIGLRTSTHAFRYSRDKDSPYAKYDFSQNNPVWSGGFGREILGETWINHHGIHAKEGTRALLDGIAVVEKNPILMGVEDIWCDTDVYGVTKVPTGATVLIWGQSTNGMTATSPVNWKKSIMPVAWTRTYSIDKGPTGRVFTTTMGAATDLLNADLRRLVINAGYWALEMENRIDTTKSVDIIGDYNPTKFGFNQFLKGKKPLDYK